MIPIILNDRTIRYYGSRGKKKKYIKQKEYANGEISLSDYVVLNGRFKDKNNRRKLRIKLGIGKGAKIIMEEQEYEMPKAFEQLNSTQQMFFILFYSINYVDATLHERTYLRADICYILAYLSRDKWDKYFDIIDDIDDEGNKVQGIRYKSGLLKSQITANAMKVLNNKKVSEAKKECTKYWFKDDDNVREQCRQAILDIAMNPNEKSADRINALKLAVNVWGLEVPAPENKVNVTIQNIDKMLKQEFDY